MKKNAIILITVLLLVAALFVACNDGTTAPEPDDVTPSNPSELSPVTFSVTFNSNGGTSVSDQNLVGVEYGQTISKPSVTPTKRGYDFVEWILSDGTAVNFDTYTVTSNVTINASWKAKSFSNVGYLTDEKIKPNIKDIGDKTAAEYYGESVDLKGDDDSSLVTVTDGQRTVALTTSYQESNSSTRLTLPVPATSIEDDYFVYWYCYEGDEIVQLSQRLEKGSAVKTVELISAYNYDEAKDIYAMWHSSLKDVIVSYLGGADDASLITSGTTIKDGDFLTAPESPTRDGYRFGNWTYNEVKDGEYVLTDSEKVKKTMSFYVDSASKGVQINHSMAINGIFELTANWTKDIIVKSADDFKALDGTDPETLSAFITIEADIDLGEWSAPFDKDNVYCGLFDGKNHTITYVATANGSDFSLLGYVNGTVCNLNINASLTATDYETTNYVNIGALAVDAKGSIIKVNSTLSVDFSSGESAGIVVGGLIAKNGATITDCTATSSISLSGKIVTAGGLVGENNGAIATSSVIGGTDYAAEISVSAANTAYVGGIAGKFESGSVKQCKVGKISLSATTNNNSSVAYVGGIAGSIANSTTTEVALDDITVTANAVGHAYVGGAYGRSSSIITHLSANSIIVNAEAGTAVCAGGLVGSNVNYGNNNASIRYTVIKKAVVNAKSTAGKVYAGGIVGDNKAGETNGTGGLVGYSFASVAVNVTAVENNAFINIVHGAHDEASIVKNFNYTSSSLKLNGNDYTAEEVNGTYKVNDAEATIKTETWVNTNLNLNVDGNASDPDSLTWIISDGSYPVLAFTAK